MKGEFVQVNSDSHMGRCRPIGYIIRDSGCWEWTGYIGPDGYGLWRRDGATRKAHRAMYQDCVGPIPHGLTLDHLCRNRSCVNPAHLEAVTSRVNILRGKSFSAVNAAITHCVNGHEFTPENTYRSTGKHWRTRACRICRKANSDRRHAALRAKKEASA